MTFGQFDTICEKASLPLCPLVGPYEESSYSILHQTGITPECFARSIDLANTIIFQVGNAFINIAALGVLVIIILNIRSKFTAIGRREILDFFLILFVTVFLSLVVDSGVVPPGSGAYAWFVAVHAGFSSACCWALMLNGLLGFQFYEDGTPRSVWGLRISSFCAFALTFIIAVLTFHGWTPDTLSPTKTTGLFVVLYLLNAIFVATYIVSQLALTIFVLHDPWALGAVGLGTFFFAAGQVILYAFSYKICDNVKHYLDGLFFASLTNLFASMMVYKYWDMITTEDLEFSVSNKESAWEVKELLDEDRRYDNGSEYAGSTYALNSHMF
ncbi:uncharacterized protein SAPINGB_P003340 [Magnusiomyces paraingens]|uniref:Chitin synthase export chaperone n=1 Tax=Magnusiomyces paraingens TaxID=2606893 RepID=A0A5E8BNU3_9ASCO|nr:uncharacterized protein SAPINGB_P003340 [Saprochaete ingens]VVT52973.1 unnamed protein product [Saprochaete ingens]